MQRFLERYWKLAHEVAGLPDGAFDEAFERQRHQIIGRVTADMGKFRFNTAVAGLMEYVNYLLGARPQPIGGGQWRAAIRTLTLLLAPIAPFVTEEIWRTVLGERDSVHHAAWPEYNEALAAEPQVTIVLQVNGKLRDRLALPAGASDEEMRAAALANGKVQSAVAGAPVREVIVVPGRLVNVVTGM